MNAQRFQTVTNDEFDFSRAKPMHNSDGIGYTVIRVGNLQIDRIYFAPGSGVDTHTHELLNHILEVKKGVGMLTREDTKTQLKRGVTYDVLAGVRHAIKACSEDGFGLDLQVTSDGCIDVVSENRLTGGGSFKDKENV